MKRIARWSTIFLLLCSIIWAGTASAAMIVNNNMSALNTLNTINNNQTPQGKDSALMRLAQEIGAGTIRIGMTRRFSRTSSSLASPC